MTFRQTDPFYTVDLSEPSNPVVRGELKITGYSGYLHPLSDDLVLGIGQDATDTGQTTGAKVTLFDVSPCRLLCHASEFLRKDPYSQGLFQQIQGMLAECVAYRLTIRRALTLVTSPSCG